MGRGTRSASTASCAHDMLHISRRIAVAAPLKVLGKAFFIIRSKSSRYTSDRPYRHAHRRVSQLSWPPTSAAGSVLFITFDAPFYCQRLRKRMRTMEQWCVVVNIVLSTLVVQRLPPNGKQLSKNKKRIAKPICAGSGFERTP